MRHIPMAVGLVSLCATLAWCQLPDLGLPDVGGLLGGVKSLTDGREPITTALSDAVLPCTFLDDFTPDEALARTEPRRGPAGEWLFPPGIYRLSLLSFCMKPGAWRPAAGGDGYLRAPLKGPRADLIKGLLHRSATRDEVSQEGMQILLWAIIARTRLQDMPAETRALAERLLTPAELAELRGAALPVLRDDVVEQLVGKLPPFLQDLLRRQNQLRGLLSQGGSYGELEAVAMGEPGEPSPAGPRPSLVACYGCWTHHPGGAFLRYDVESYALTHLWVVVPRQVTIARDRQGRITSLDDGQGCRVETTYQPRGLRFRSEPGLRACRFATIRCILRDPAQPGGQREYLVRDRGWTFVGQPRRPVKAAASGAVGLRWAEDEGGGDEVGVDQIIDDIAEELVGDGYEGLKDRYEQAKGLKESIDEWVDVVDKGVNGVKAEHVADLVDTGHYKDGYQAAVSQDVEAQGDWLGAHMKLGVESYMYAADTLARAGDDAETAPITTTKPFNPALVTQAIRADMGVPQRPEAQRVSLWERLFGK